jgi:hypothetical protein
MKQAAPSTRPTFLSLISIAAVPGFFALALGCGTGSRDSSLVLANVAGQKITQKEFEGIVRALAPKPSDADALLKDPKLKDRRNQLVGNLAEQRALIELARIEGIDKDVKVRLQAESSLAEVYKRAIIEKRAAAITPPEAELRKIYDEAIAQQKASGNTQPIPAFEAVRAELVRAWQQKQQQQAQERLVKELKERVPVSYAEGYQPNQVAGN